MKTSETWNQAFEEMRFDNQHGHLVSEDQINPNNNEHFIFESQELPLARPPPQGPRPHDALPNTRNPDSSSLRGQQRYQYSQTERGQSSSEPRRGQESHIEDKSLRILDNSNLSNANQEQGRNRDGRGEPQPNAQLQANNQLIIQVHPNHQKSKTQVMKTPPHYPHMHFNQVVFQQHQPPAYNELETLPLPPQHSYAPSQKTLVMPHAQGLAASNPVFRSHLATERLQSQLEEQTGKRMASPVARSSYDLNPVLRQEGVWNSMIQKNQKTLDNFSESNPPKNEAQWWRDKYEEIRHHFEAYRANHLAELEAASNQIHILERQNKLFKENYDKLALEHKKRGEQLKALKQGSNAAGQGNDFELKKQLQERGMLINLLKKQNQQLRQQLEHQNQVIQQWQGEFRELQENVSVLRMELEQKDDEIAELKKSQSQLKQNDISQFSRSRVQSVENTKILELEMHTGRLMAEMAARDESYEQEIKLCTIKFNELADKYQSTVAEKDQIIRNLQEKVAILDSDLNKKDSLLRNLRDELVEAERKKTTHVHNSHIHTNSPKQSTTSASAINPPFQRAEKTEHQAKREIDNLRKHLFDKERELTIQNQRQEEMRQILAQTENTANRRKNEMQALRRQIADYQDKLAEYEMLKETLQKKNEELAELREILIQKQYSGQYQSLTKENEKLREISIKRNAEISDLNERLLAAEKKIREQQSFNPQIEALEEEVEMLRNHIRSMQSQIQQLTVNLQHSNQKILEAELQVERERERQVEMENLLQDKENELEEMQLCLQKSEQREQLLQRQLESLATKTVKTEKENQELAREQQLYKEQLIFYQRELASRNLELEAVSHKHMQLEMIKQTSLKEVQQIEEKHEEENKRKDQEIQALTAKLREIEAQSKGQKQKLAKLEPEVDILRNKLTKHHHCERQINELSDKVTTYEMKILNTTYARQLFHDYPMPAAKVFENRLIYQLKNENESLRREAGRNVCLNTSNSLEQHSGMRGRINEHLPGVQQNITEQQTLRRVKSHEALQSNSEKTHPKKGMAVPVQSIGQLQKFYHQKLADYRCFNIELEQRISQLIKLNQELKDKISRMTNNHDEKLKQFLQEQLRFEKQSNQRLQKQLTVYKKENRRIENELKELKRRQRFEVPATMSHRYTIRDREDQNP